MRSPGAAAAHSFSRDACCDAFLEIVRPDVRRFRTRRAMAIITRFQAPESSGRKALSGRRSCCAMHRDTALAENGANLGRACFPLFAGRPSGRRRSWPFAFAGTGAALDRESSIIESALTHWPVDLGRERSQGMRDAATSLSAAGFPVPEVEQRDSQRLDAEAHDKDERLARQRARKIEAALDGA